MSNEITQSAGAPAPKKGIIARFKGMSLPMKALTLIVAIIGFFMVVTIGCAVMAAFIFGMGSTNTSGTSGHAANTVTPTITPSIKPTVTLMSTATPTATLKPTSQPVVQDPIVGTWYYGEKTEYYVIYADGTWDFQLTTYIDNLGGYCYEGGVWTKDSDNTYWLLTTKAGKTKDTASKNGIIGSPANLPCKVSGNVLYYLGDDPNSEYNYFRT